MSKGKIVMVFRKPLPTNFSIEYLFHNVFKELAKFDNQLNISEFTLPKQSKGIVNRIQNIRSLIKFKNCIIHITGDSYYAILGAIYAKRIITIHDLHFLTRTTGLRRKLLKLFWVKLPAKYAHKITVVSEATKKEVIKETGICPNKIVVVYNFIDPVYQPVKRSPMSESPTILQIGTTFNKNIDRLSQALKGINCKLIIIGRLSNEQHNTLKAYGIHYENKFGLPISALFEEYAKADLLTFVSTVEGFGLPILEAQATGLPVITSNCSSMPEVAGRGALQVDPFDIQSIKQGILKMISDQNLRQQLIEEGYKNAARFSRNKITRDYLSVYEELLKL